MTLFGHGKISSGRTVFSFKFGGGFLLILWACFLMVLGLMYTFTFHESSDFEKESLKLKYEKRALLDEGQLSRKDLSDLQSREFVENSEVLQNMVEASEIDYFEN